VINRGKVRYRASWKGEWGGGGFDGSWGSGRRNQFDKSTPIRSNPSIFRWRCSREGVRIRLVGRKGLERRTRGRKPLPIYWSYGGGEKKSEEEEFFEKKEEGKRCSSGGSPIEGGRGVWIQLFSNVSLCRMLRVSGSRSGGGGREKNGYYERRKTNTLKLYRGEKKDSLSE